jgi:hypothetical protein
MYCSRTVGSFFILAAIVFSQSAATAQGLVTTDYPVPGDVVINELMVDPYAVSDTDGEYIELYNNTDNDIDLQGWTLEDDGLDYHLIDNGGPLIVGPREYVVLARNADSTQNGGFTADYEYSGLVLSNTTDELILSNPGGTTIDSLIYSRDLGFPLEVGSSIELRNQRWENTMGAAWANAILIYGDGDFGSPGSKNSTQEDFKWVAVDVSITEVNVSPGDSLVVLIEIFNPSWLNWMCDAASFLMLPGGSPFWGNPLDGPVSLQMTVGRYLYARRSYYIPEAAFTGIYRIYYGVRENGGDVLDYESVDFHVSAL